MTSDSEKLPIPETASGLIASMLARDKGLLPPTTATEQVAAMIAKDRNSLPGATATGHAASVAERYSNTLPPAAATAIAAPFGTGINSSDFGGSVEALARAELEARSTAMMRGDSNLSISEANAKPKTTTITLDVTASLETGATVSGADTPLPLKAAAHSPGPLERFATIVEEDDTAPATGSMGFGIDVGGITVAGESPSEIWLRRGGNPFLQIDRAEQELKAVQAFVLTWRAQSATDPRADNNPPALLGDPDIDIEDIDAALQCLVVLRRLVIQPEPDIEILKLLWLDVVAAIQKVWRFAKWAAQLPVAALKQFESTVFGKAFTGALAVKLAGPVGDGIISEISKHGPAGLQSVEHLIRGAMTALSVVL